MKLQSLLIALVLISVYAKRLQDDRDKSIKTIVRENGYWIEEHNVLTEDKYWLKMFRVINPSF